MIKQKLIVSFIFLMLGIFINNATHAANMSAKVIPIEGEKVRFIKVNGDITPGDDFKLNVLIEKYEETDNPVTLLVLDSNGGDVKESHEMVSTVLNYELSTIVLPNEKCLSACFAIFAAGDERALHPKSIIGVHRAKSADGKEDSIDSKLAVIGMKKMYQALNVPSDIIKKMMKTPSHKMYYLSIDEKKAMSTALEAFEVKKEAPVDEGITAAGEW